MNGAAQDLGNILSGACLTDEASLISRTRDSWPQAFCWPRDQLLRRLPLAVALPQSEDQVSAVLRWALRHDVPVVPRGAGSGVVGAAIPESAALVLDLSRLCSRFELGDDCEGPFVAVAAGMLGGELESRLNSRGYSLLHFPASLEVSTAGGWVATRSFGQLSTRYGGIERQALSLRVAYPGGDIGQEPPAGHVGAEGTSGVITEVTLRIRRVAQSRGGVGLSFGSVEEALAYIRALWQSPLDRPSVLRLYGPVDALLSLRSSGGKLAGLREGLEPFAMRHYAWLNSLGGWLARSWVVVLIYEDAPQALEAARALPGAKTARAAAAPALNWWNRRYHWSGERLKNVFARGCFADTMDLWGRWDDLPKIERAVARAIRPHALVMSHMSHFDSEGACLYVTFAGAGDGPDSTIERHKRAWRAGIEACVELGGRVNHHHGIGLAKLPWIDSAVDGAWRQELRLAKRARDPKGLLNPGKLCL